MEIMVKEALYTLIDAVKSDPIYQEYDRRLYEIKQEPQLKEKLDEFRQRNFELQNQEPGDLFEQIDALENEAERFREDIRVDAFLSAEVAFCRMMQEIHVTLVDAVEFE